MRPKKIYILTGEIQTGKSAFLLEWIKNKNTSGFITPTLQNKKVFYSITEDNYFSYQLTEFQEGCITIGKYFLDKQAFILSRNIAENAYSGNFDFFILDEIGRLELKKEGHFDTLHYLLKNYPSNLILVVRKSLVEIICEEFFISEAIVVSIANMDEVINT